MSSTHAGQVRPPVGDLDAELAVFLEADLQREDLGVGPRAADDVARVLDEQRRLERVREGRLGEGLAGVLVERRLRVEGLQVADAAGEEDPDDRLGLRREVRLAVGGDQSPTARPCRRGAASRPAPGR